MKQLTKQDILNKLYEIAEKENLDFTREVQKTIRNEIVPMEVIKILNKYDKKFIPIYDTYNTIYSSRNKNPLYRNLRNKYIEVEEAAIAISSLVTKILISISKIPEQDRRLFATAMNVKGLNDAIIDYTLGNNDSIMEQHNQVRELLELLFLED
ncbi:hypothetical protein [uncultured Clostridium sp.]|uniref:hypothetical protein n=1 Tax=uncultured Clostridium sp. TaxID=59620 RepID=UPI0026F0511F|nr:hypothetical protein [uncultured Clostridium sp.]